MDVKGNHVFKVSRERLWNYLMDPEVLAKITPGISKLEVTGTDAYNTISNIKIGPVKGAFKGKLKVEDKSEPNSFVINMEQLSKIGNAHAKINMRIEENESGLAELFFDGNAKLSGMIARTGQRVLSGVANAITKEVFSALENHIDENANENVNQHSKDQANVTETIENLEESKATEIKQTPENNFQTTQLQDKNPPIKRDNTLIANVDEEIKEKVANVHEVASSTSDTDIGFFASITNFFNSIFKR